MCVITVIDLMGVVAWLCSVGSVWCVSVSTFYLSFSTLAIIRKANWIGHRFRRNSLLKHVGEGKIERRNYGKTRKKT